VLQRTGDPASAVGELETLARTEPAFVQERHELYYELARAHYALQHFDKAVRAARAYVEAAARADKLARDPLPEPLGAPATDAPGDSEKAWKQQPFAMDANLTRLAKKGLTP
jgi:hypothetical protein